MWIGGGSGQPPGTGRADGGVGPFSAGDLFHQRAYGEVDTQLADLAIVQVADNRVRHADCPAGGLYAGELTGMGADEIRLECRFILID